jgi:dipeptidyl-peptidase 4
MLRKTPIAALLFLAAAVAAVAQDVKTTPQPKPTLKEITIENIFDPKQRVAFSGAIQSGYIWLDDKTFTWPRTDDQGTVLEQAVVDTETGKKRVLFDAAKLEAAAKKIPGVSPEEAKRMTTQRGWNFSPNKKSVILSVAEDLYLYAFDSDSFTRLTSAPGAEEEAAFSPDGKFVSFVRDNDLFVVDVAEKRERQLTTDGNENTLNGILDWVYQEEVYGRGNFRAYWWSPDSSRLAFMKLDERPVHRFAVVDHIPYRQTVESELYPKAGDPNPIARLYTVTASGGTPREVSTEQYTGADFLIVSVDWSPSNKLTYQIQDREQTWLDLNILDGATPKRLLRETTKAWVEPLGNPEWLKDGSFLWLSERSGFKHIYHYNADGTLKKQVTSGPWEVRALHGVDAANEWIYWSGTERSVLGSDVYRVKLDGSGLKRLSEAAGTHTANFNPAYNLWIDSWSDVSTPTQISLMRNDGTRVRVLEANEAPRLREYRTAKPEFLQVKTRDGFVMEAMMIKPPDFDPSKKYPVYQYTYAGPHAQSVRNGWGRSQYLWYQFLANQGIVVWVLDNRSASGKGMESAWTSYQRVGELELKDLEDGVRWLTSQPYIDGSRVMLDGWSFGGYMTSYALTRSKLWKAGIAGGSVTDWRDYDSIYTERIMRMPQNNPEGYKATAPRAGAKDLSGNLLLLHGTIDDNVHVQNTIQFAYDLQKAGKQFRMMLYPKSRHGVSDPQLALHMRNTMWAFIQENLLR